MERFRRLSLLLVLLCVAPVHAAATDCDGPAATTLRPAADLGTDARAYWLDGSHVRWPGQPRTGRYRLLASGRAGLQLGTGTPARGIEQAFELGPAVAEPASVAERFGFVG